MIKDISIGNRIIGPNRPVFITAEVGVTCNYDLTIAKELIDIAAQAGADAAKFIFWFPDELMSDKTISYTYQTITGEKSENMYEMVSKLRFSFEQWQELKAHADKKNIILFATIGSPSGVAYARNLNLDAVKLGSWEFNNLTLWKEVTELKKPIIADTGPATTLEIMKAVDIATAGGCPVLLVHCFHTENYNEMNMRSIPYMHKTFRTQVGFSPNDQESTMDIMALSLGAVFLEKRLTLSKKLPGHHHFLSMEPDEFSTYVSTMRNIQQALGEEDIKPSHADLEERRKWFRSLVANQHLPAGTVITPAMLASKRPAEGISPEFHELFIGKILKRDLQENELISWSDV